MAFFLRSAAAPAMEIPESDVATHIAYARLHVPISIAVRVEAPRPGSGAPVRVIVPIAPTPGVELVITRATLPGAFMVARDYTAQIHGIAGPPPLYTDPLGDLHLLPPATIEAPPTFTLGAVYRGGSWELPGMVRASTTYNPSLHWFSWTVTKCGLPYAYGLECVTPGAVIGAALLAMRDGFHPSGMPAASYARWVASLERMTAAGLAQLAGTGGDLPW